MKTTLPSRSLASVALATLVLALPSCATRSCSERWDALGISPEVAASDGFLERASARDWYLVSGSCFYRLDEYVDCLLLPDPGEEEPIDYKNAQFFGAFDLSAGGDRIVAESYNRQTSYRTAYLVIYDEKLATVFEDEDQGRSRSYAPYRWSPDGKYVSFAHESEVRVLDVEKKTYRTVATDHAPVVNVGPPYGTPSWDDEPNLLTYQTHDNEIAIVHIGTGKARRIGKGCMPSWSPDGSKIAFLEDRLGRRGALVYHTETGQMETLFTTSSNQPFIWSPDGQFLVFSKGLLNSRFGELVVYSFETGKVRSTGRQVGTIRGAQIEVLPEWFTSRLREHADNERENPNRRKALR